MSKTISIAGQIKTQPLQRKMLDVGAWRRALRAADQDRIKELYDMYEDLLVDNRVGDGIDKRIEAVLQSGLTFVDADKEEVEELSELMETLEWEELLRGIMRTRFWGRSAFELDFSDGLKVSHIPSKHINLKDKTILLKDTDRVGIPYEDNPFVVVLGKRYDFGLLLNVAPYVIYKRGGFADWAQWIEIFGMPQRVGKYNLHDPEVRAELEAALERAGSASWITVPEGTEVEHIETSNGNGAAYDDFRKACNEEITISLLGQTLTTSQGDSGARSLGEVHREVELSKYLGDLRYTQRILNQYIRPRLEARGFPVKGGKFIFPKASVHLEVSEVIQLSDIIDIPKTYLHDCYGIPMAAEGEEIARRSSQSQPSAYTDPLEDDDEEEGAEPTQEPHKPKPIRNSDEQTLWQRFVRFFGLAPSTQLGAHTSALHTIDIRLADAATINDRLIERTIAGEIGDFDIELWRWTSNRLITALQEGFGSDVRLADHNISTTYGAQRDALITAMEINLYRFGAAKTLAEAQHLNQLFRESTSVRDFRAKAVPVLDRYNRQWLETEYTTAHLSALAAAKHQELKTKTRLYPYWEYKTVGDDRVRADHAALNGVILKHDDPLWDEIYPPNGYNCRCSVEPRLAHEGRKADVEEMRKRVKDYQQTTDWQAAKAMGWDSNRATLGEVFSKNQQYVTKMPGKSSSKILDLQAKDYGLDSLDKEINKPNRPKLTLYEGTAADWYREHPSVLDHKGRAVVIDSKVYQRHTTGGHKERVKLLNAMTETMSSPDEVWLNNYTGDSPNKLCHIKYYEGTCLVAICELRNGVIYQLSTWYEISSHSYSVKPSAILKYGKKGAKKRTHPKLKYRRGLLITAKRADT